MGLTVYKSSAGSGKTFTLVKEYLKIALDNPEKIRHILAITFTNKAAAEMKTRIIEKLKEFSNGVTEDTMAKMLSQELNIDNDTLKEKSIILLGKIIHNYDDFNVSTIDSFIHKIIRTFAKDVELPSDFEVVIDLDEMIPEIVNELYEKIADSKELKNLLVNFVNSLSDDEKNYDPQRKFEEFIEDQVSEEGFQEIKKLQNITLNQFNYLINNTYKKIKEIKEKIITASKNSENLIKNAGLSSAAFYNGTKGFATYITRFSKNIDEDKLIPNTTVLKTINENKWYSSSASGQDKVAIDTIKKQLKENFYTISSLADEYILLRLIYSKLHQTALLKEIRTLFDEYTQNTGKVHITDFNKKISDNISGQSAPFIYERIGNKFEHYLIDEFQDTSILQWHNLFPLIENAYSSIDPTTQKSNFNMLVGDPKQAIYRFRNGEVELFTSLPEIYGNPDNDFKKIPEEYIEFKNLDVNFRSFKKIVEFNNNFFKILTADKPELIKKIYKEHNQNIFKNKNHDGYVSIELIEAETKEEYDNKRLLKIKGYIDKLISKGFRLKDICVLTRNKNHATQIASHLFRNEINVISSESLQLKNSIEVRTVVSFIKILVEPNNRTIFGEFVYDVLQLKNKTKLFNELILKYGSNTIDIKGFLEYLNIDIDIESLMQKPVYQMAEMIYDFLVNDNKPNIYFQYFLDFIHEKEQYFEGRIDLFLELWEEKKEKLFIATPDGEDAVKIMTIHQAKGLKFQVVILDYIDRLVHDKTKDEFWTTIEKTDNIQVPDLPVFLLPIVKKLEKVKMGDVYEKESVKTELDRINLIYVAFTRAVEALFLIAQAPVKINGKLKKPTEKFSKLILEYLEKNDEFSENKFIYEYGELKKLEKAENENREYEILDKINIESENLSVLVAPPDELYWELGGNNSKKMKGIIFHKILSKIKDINDLEKILVQELNKGTIDKNELENFKSELLKVIKHPELKIYFDSDIKIKTEIEIIEEKGEIIRPDRIIFFDDETIIIDYKTGKEQKEHIHQIKRYLKAIRPFTNNKITGKLIYLDSEIKIIDITDN
jgi:ATP-dependent exoDNAse (exonuclease V) beta subunit